MHKDINFNSGLTVLSYSATAIACL